MALFDEVAKIEAAVAALDAKVSAITAPDLSTLASKDDVAALLAADAAIDAKLGTPPAA